MTGVMPPSKPEEEGVFAQGTPTPSGHYHPISVIIPTYNRQKWLEEILASIAVQTLPVEQFEVIVVDDGSKDGTREVAHKAYPFRLRYFYQTNQGDAAARNLGAKHSEAEFLVFLDDDIILDKDFLANLVVEHQAQPHRIIVGADTLWVEDANPFEVGVMPPAPAPDQPAVVALPFVEVCSNNMSIRREAYFEVGMMEGLDFRGSSIWCDVDFSFRAYRKNFEFLRSQRALCWHRDYVAKSFENRKKRMREVAYRAVALFHKYPELVYYLPMFADKTPVDWKQDSVGLVLKKWARFLTSSTVFLWGAERLLGVFRRWRVLARFEPALSRWVVGGYIFRGYRAGLRELGPVRVVPRRAGLDSMEKS